jgi:SET domain-containing protein
VVTGLINNTNDAPSLEEEMAAIVTPKVAKRQCLTNNDCGDVINKFAEKSSVFYSAFSNYFENKAKADNRSFLLQLLDKLEKGVITQQQFEEMKASFL